MRHFQTVTAGLCVAVMSTVPALASDVMIYPYATSENYCPDNLQPVVVLGEISCGQPNTHVTWQQVMGQKQRGKAKRHAPARIQSCPIGVKGC